MPVPESMLPLPPSGAIADLRALVGTMGERADEGTALRFHVPMVDDRLAGGGLASNALHEISAAKSALGEDAAATLFIAGIAGRFAGAAAVGSPVLWAATRFDLYAPGIDQVGLQAGVVIFAEAKDDAEVLALLEDAVRDGSPAAVIGEVRRAGMTSTRRLQLAAGDRNVPVLLYRRWRKADVDPLVEPSAAMTRWRIGCAPSGPTDVGIPRARWSVELVRQRGGEPFSLVLEACDVDLH